MLKPKIQKVVCEPSFERAILAIKCLEGKIRVGNIKAGEARFKRHVGFSTVMFYCCILF
uniref:Uncharacterized protein n=1 Tax=Rhizophora mucronata TaxID=61149 RepID=A0A2P2M8E6_RHIMU